VVHTHSQSNETTASINSCPPCENEHCRELLLTSIESQILFSSKIHHPVSISNSLPPPEFDLSSSDHESLEKSPQHSSEEGACLDDSPELSRAVKQLTSQELSVFLKVPTPLSKKVAPRKKARVLTSQENLQLLEQKEKEKQELIEQKEHRKREREEKRKQKEFKKQQKVLERQQKAQQREEKRQKESAKQQRQAAKRPKVQPRKNGQL